MIPASAALPSAPEVPRAGGAGLGWGIVGIVAFSFTVPLTRVAAEGGLDPLFIGAGRAVLAAVLAALALGLTRQRWPRRAQWARLALVAAGVVVGFPLLTSYALRSVEASHAAVVIGLLPAATAAMAVLRGGERVGVRFWVFAALGAMAVVVFTAVHGGGLGGLAWADLLLLGAVVAAASGYAEGGLLARELGAWQTVSWALVLAAPLMAGLTLVSVQRELPSAGTGPWLAFGYLGVVSMFLGFFAWYRGLAVGPMALVSQVQLVQPVLSIVWAAALLGERLTWSTLLGGVLVMACAWAAVRSRAVRRSR